MITPSQFWPVAVASICSAFSANVFTSPYPDVDWVKPTWTHSDALCEPETALVLADGKILLSNVCGFATPATGYLSRLDHEGRLLEARFIDHLDSPLGMALHEQLLLVVDSNTVRCFELDTKTPCGQVALPSKVANDIAVASDGRVFVTDTAGGKVYHYTRGVDEVPIALAQEFAGANGIAVDGETLWVGGERLWQYSLETGVRETVGPDWLGDIDGIELEAGGAVQVTPVDGPVVRLNDGQVESVRGVQGAGSANHGYSPHTGQAIIPTGFDNRVVAFEMPQVRIDQTH